MDLCIDEKDEERESEAQSVVRAKKRARGGGVGGWEGGGLGGRGRDLQTDFGDIFYTFLNQIEACVSLDSPKLSGKVENWKKMRVVGHGR